MNSIISPLRSWAAAAATDSVLLRCKGGVGITLGISRSQLLGLAGVRMVWPEGLLQLLGG